VTDESSDTAMLGLEGIAVSVPVVARPEDDDDGFIEFDDCCGTRTASLGRVSGPWWSRWRVGRRCDVMVVLRPRIRFSPRRFR
jgi:hypothetical protein